MAHWIKCISQSGNIRGVAIDGREVVRDAMKRHQTKGVEAERLGEILLGALLYASYCKPGERVHLTIQSSGEMQSARSEARPDGSVRGYVTHRPEAGKTRGDGTEAADTGHGPWGTGFMNITRSKLDDFRSNYAGTVPLLTGHLAKDFSFYWVQSEQVPSAVGITVKVEEEQVKAASAFLIQAMPGALPEEVASIENHLLTLEGYTEKIESNPDPLNFLAGAFQNFQFQILEQKPVRFQCTCSRERMLGALVLVGADELNAMIKEDGKANVRCDFCATQYEVNKKELEDLLKSSR